MPGRPLPVPIPGAPLILQAPVKGSAATSPRQDPQSHTHMEGAPDVSHWPFGTCQSGSGSNPAFHSIAMELPSWFMKTFEQKIRAFLWAGSDSVNGGQCLVAWDRICRPIESLAKSRSSPYSMRPRRLTSAMAKSPNSGVIDGSTDRTLAPLPRGCSRPRTHQGETRLRCARPSLDMAGYATSLACSPSR